MFCASAARPLKILTRVRISKEKNKKNSQKPLGFDTQNDSLSPLYLTQHRATGTLLLPTPHSSIEMTIQGLNRFLAELESHCQSTAIATFVGSDGESFAVDLKRWGDRVIYGYQEGIKERFAAFLAGRCKPSGSVVLRSFTSEIDEFTRLPVKELRGYVLQFHSDRFEFEKISPNMMFACQNTDAKTGEPLPLEQAVKYC